MLKITMNQLEDTQALGEYLGQSAPAGSIIILSGDLGAGKTTLTKGIGKGLGIEQMIKSPTYTIIKEYESGRLPFYHMDIYRIKEGMDELGLDDYFEGKGLCVVEWGELLEEELPADYLKITINKLEAENEREFVLEAAGQTSSKWLEAIKEWKK